MYFNLCIGYQGRREPERALGHNLLAPPPIYILVSRGYLEVNKLVQTIAFALYLVIYSLITECPTFGQYLVWIFDRVAVSRGRSPRIPGNDLTRA